MLQWTSLLLLLLLTAVAASKHPESPAPSPAAPPGDFEQTLETFVEHEAATDTSGMTVPLKLSFWTTPDRDWDATTLQRLKGLVARFGPPNLLAFHPHQGIVDGTYVGCRNPNGPTDIARLGDVCLENCVNVGRYCSVPFPSPHALADDPEHAGLIGANLMEESARRLCVWIVYATGDDREGMLKYFDYVAALRDTKCDRSMSDTCLDKVYRQVGIDGNEMADCIHNAGGIGSQVDTMNGLMNEEMHRSNRMNLTYDGLPYLAIDGNLIDNVTTLSDWQIMAEVCSAFANPKPLICDFCLMECPIGNDDHDPTYQCVWDLTCGDDRTFDDWLQGTGPFANHTNTTDLDNEEFDEDVDSAPEKETPVPSIAPSTAPTDSPTEADDDAIEWVDVPGATNETDTDNLELDDDHVDDVNATVPPLKPPHDKPTGHHAPTPKPTEAPHQSKPTYNSPIAQPQPTQHSTGGPGSSYTTHAPHATSGGTLSHSNSQGSAPQMKAPNTSNSASMVEGLAVAVVCLSVLVFAVVMVKRYATGKDVYATVDHRDANGLASTASHATESDLQLHVEMGRGKRRDGYAPPEKEGTWG
jgi:hypothetical protein